MSITINICIEGNHATDALAELKNLADALNAKNSESSAVKAPILGETKQQESEDNFEFVGEPKKSTPKVKSKYSAKDQKEIADNMIADGEIDEEVLNDLNETQQKRVKKALEDSKKEETKSEVKKDEFEFDEDDVIFDDIEESTKLITMDELKAAIEAKCENNAENYKLVREETRKVIPSGKDLKFANIPSDKINVIFDFVNSLKK